MIRVIIKSEQQCLVDVPVNALYVNANGPQWRTKAVTGSMVLGASYADEYLYYSTRACES